MSTVSVAPEPIAIVGIGAMFPGRGDTLGYWRDIMEGVDAIGPVPPTHWLPDDYYDADPKAPDKTYGKTGGFLKPQKFDPLAFGVPPTTLQATDTAQLLALMVAKEALDQACATTLNTLPKEKVSVILGVASTTELVAHMSNRLQRPVWLSAMRKAGMAEDEAEQLAQSIADHYVPWQEATFPGLLGNVVAGRIANRLDLGGCNYVTDAACASSLSALQAALYELYSGNSDAVLAGGVDALNDILMYMCFSKTPALSPSGDCRPFSDKADGTVLGEGVGIVALRRLADAERDGNSVYAVIKGLGAGSDGRATAIYAPLPSGQARALNRAYDAAGVSPRTVELVEAHGTGTKAGDAAEIQGLRQVYERAGEPGENWAAIGSVKSQIGHTKAAAGAASLIKTALALHHKVLPPTLKVDRPNSSLGLEESAFHVNTEARPWVRGADHPRRAAVSSFGFGGSNFHVVLEEYAGPNKAARLRTLPAELVLLSADTEAALVTAIRSCADALAGGDDLSRVASSSHASFCHDHGHRLALVARSSGELGEKLRKLSSIAPRQWADIPDPDIVFGHGAPVSGDIAFLFPGQGSQHVGMGADLAMAFDNARAVWDRAADNTNFAEAPLHQLAFPPPAFDDAAKAEADERLTRMEHAQPALAAASVSMLALLSRMGLKPDMAAGHSFGELVAFHAAGALDETSLFNLAAARGRAMAKAAAGSEGAMSAVSAPAATVLRTLGEPAGNIVLANDNAPGQVVISGATPAISAAEHRLSQAGVHSRRLPVASAFHTSIVAGAVAPFARALARESIAAPRMPVFSNATAQRYATAPEEIRAGLAEQLRQPVRFRQQVEAMHQAGARVFVEVGSSAVLSGLARQCLEGREAVVTPLAHRRNNGVIAFWRGVARLAAAGVAFDVQPLLTDAPPAPTSPPPSPHAVELTGANHDKPYPPTSGVPMSTSKRDAPPSRPTHERVADATPVASVSSASPSAPLVAGFGGVTEELSRLHAEYLRTTASAHETFLGAMKDIALRIEGTPPVAHAEMVAPSPPAEPPTLPQLTSMMRDEAPIESRASAPDASPAASIRTTDEMTPPFAPLKASAVSGSADDLAALIRDLVAEKTGYPTDMLDEGMDLEGELGVDSIKQVEILAALKERAPDLPDIDPTRLSELRSIGAIARALRDGNGPSSSVSASMSAVPVAVAVAAPEPVADASVVNTSHPAPTQSEAGGVADLIRRLVAEKTGYPEDMLDNSMDLEGELGVDSIKQVEILAALRDEAPELPEIDPAQLAELRSIEAIAAALGGAPGAMSAGVAPYAPQAPQPDPEPGAVNTAPIIPAPSNLANLIRELVAEKTGYPADMLDDGMDLEGELGVDSIKQVEILAALKERAPHLPEIDPARLAELRSIGAIASALAGEESDETSPPTVVKPADNPSPTAAPSRVNAWALRAEARPASDMALGGLLSANAVEVTDDGGEIASALANALAARGVPARLVTAPSGEADVLVLMTGLRSSTPQERGWRAVEHVQRAAAGLAREGAALVTVQASGGSFGVCDGSLDEAWCGGLTGLAKTAAVEWPHLAIKAIDVATDGLAASLVSERIADELCAGGPEREVGLAADGGRLGLVERPLGPVEATGLLTDGFVVVAVGGARGVTANALRALAKRAQLRIALVGRSGQVPWPEGLNPALDEVGLRSALAARARVEGRSVSPASIAADARTLLASREIADSIGALEGAGAEVMYLQADATNQAAIASALGHVRSRWGRIDGLVHAAGVLADKRINDLPQDKFDHVFQPKVAGLSALLDAARDDDLQFLAVFSSVAGRYGNEGQVAYAMANETIARAAWAEARLRPSCIVKAFDWGPWDGGMVGDELRKVFAERGVGLIDMDEGAELFAEAIDFGSPGDIELIVGPSLAPPTATWRADISLPTDSPLLRDHVIAGKPVLPAMQALVWMHDLANAALPGEGTVHLDNFATLAGVSLEAHERRFKAQLAATPVANEPGVRELTLHTDDGRVRYRARASRSIDGPSETPAQQSGSSWELGVSEAYQTLFHGPAFQVLASLDVIGVDGAECSLRLQDPIGVDAPLLDGGLQAAYLWGMQPLGGGSLPTAIRRAMIANIAASDQVRCTLSSRKVAAGKAIHDIAYWTNDGRLLARLEGVEMCAAPALAGPEL